MQETDERGPKERAYDEEIGPRMTEIIAICKRAGIPVYASYALDGDLACTTYIVPSIAAVPEDDREYVQTFRRKHDAAARAAESPAFAITVTSPKVPHA